MPPIVPYTAGNDNMNKLSIRTQLSLAFSMFFVLAVGLSVASLLGLHTLSQAASEVNGKWLSGTRLLGDMTGELAEMRVAQMHRALVRTVEAAHAAEDEVQVHRLEVYRLLGEYRALVGRQFARREIDSFEILFNRYVNDYDYWVKRDTTLEDSDPALPYSNLGRLYAAADRAVGMVTVRNAEAAASQVAAAAALERWASIGVGGALTLGGLLTILLIAASRARISGPLSEITTALKRLAEGRSDLKVPAQDRADEIGDLVRAFEVFRTRTEQLAEAQSMAAALARHDGLTGLPNRRALGEELGRRHAASASAGAGAFSLLLVDLDRFKPVNDLFGHATGDQVLCHVAQRLTRVVTRPQLVARLGGDEFAVIGPAAEEAQAAADAAARLAKQIVAALREPMLCNGQRVEIGASVGISVCPADGTEPGELVRAADLALDRSKQEGPGSVRFFEAGMDRELRLQASLEQDLRAAIAAGRIEPYYQPQIDFARHRVSGFEVLARWRHPERGFVSPAEFVPIAEQLGLMDALMTALLRQVCRDGRAWSEDITLSLNVTAAQFQDPSLPARILAVLHEEGFPAERLELEVTESALVGDLQAAKTTLEALRGAGIGIALDDFGTGYSSLYQLRALRFDRIKIDRSFVSDMQANPESRKITDAVLGLAHSLGMSAVAEGIEEAATLIALEQRGCEYGQGYLFSKAVPAAEAATLPDQLDRALAATAAAEARSAA